MRKKILMVAIVVACLLAATVYWQMNKTDTERESMPSSTSNTPPADDSPAEETKPGPLAGKKFYVDTQRNVDRYVAQYKASGDLESVALLSKIASQPSAIWLNGPTPGNETADRDIQEVSRTSLAAKTQGSVPVYVIYAIPNRDACAEFSKGGFNTPQEYTTWINRIVSELKTEAVFIVEPDAVGHTVRTNCLNSSQTAERYALLSQTLATFKSSPNVLASYLDAGHSEWFPDPNVLIEPLKKAGVSSSNGISVNVSNFIATTEISGWAKSLGDGLGENKAVVIDTSRNGKGAADAGVTGQDRWCNPSGRGLGNVPSGDTNDRQIDAYLWIKVPGESDGNCRGYPAAGTFVPRIALELARNAAE